jgi:hypothetical protein
MQGLQLSDHVTSVDNVVCMRLASKSLNGVDMILNASFTCLSSKMMDLQGGTAADVRPLILAPPWIGTSISVWTLGSHSESQRSLGQCELWSQVSHVFGKNIAHRHHDGWIMIHVLWMWCQVHRTAHFSPPSCQQRNWNLLRSERMRTMSQGPGAHWSCDQICFLFNTSRFWPICNNWGVLL